jgi:hypothetical protein
LKIKTRAVIAVAIVGLGLLIGSQITAGGTEGVTSPSEAPPNISPSIYLLIPTTVSVSVASLNGSALLIVAQMTGNLTSLPPIVNVSVIQKDIVTFSIPTRGYYEVEFLTNAGTAPAVTYSLTEGGAPPDQTLFGTVVFIAGLAGVALVSAFSRRRKVYRSDANR